MFQQGDKTGEISTFSCCEEEEDGGGGLLTAVRHGVCTSLVISEGENSEFLTVKLIFGSAKIRLILVYGPQEYSSESDKETFWNNIHVEVERVKLAGENLLL